MSGARLRATVDACGTLAAGLFAFVPFLPRLLRAAFTGRRDRARMLELIRDGLNTPADDPPPTDPRPLRVFLIAGEPSGDRYAADLARALVRVAPGTTVEGVGGSQMEAAGVRVIADLVSEPVMGVWPVIMRLPIFFGLYRDLVARFEEERPDVIVGVDYPGLNIRLARAARKRGVPFVEYVTPQVWAWAPWRVHGLVRDVPRLLSILPFEKQIFEAAGGDVAFVGHPLIGHLAAAPSEAVYTNRLRAGLDDGALVAILPGSRRREVRSNLPLLLAAACRVAAARPGTRFVVSLAAERLRATFDAVLAARETPPDLVVAEPDATEAAMRAADAALTVSGTVTLHLVVHDTPPVVVYRAGAAHRFLSRYLLVSPYFALPNLLAGARVVPEILASGRDGKLVADALLDLLPGGAGRARALAALAQIRGRLEAGDVPDRVARWVAATATPTSR